MKLNGIDLEDFAKALALSCDQELQGFFLSKFVLHLAKCQNDYDFTKLHMAYLADYITDLVVDFARCISEFKVIGAKIEERNK